MQEKALQLDLTDPKDRDTFLQYKKKYFNNFALASPEIIQNSFKMREDAKALYQGKPQKYNTFIINTEYDSPSALAEGAPTYTFKDPHLRKLMQEDALRFNKQQKENKLYNVVGDVGTIFGNYSVNKMHDDGSGRYVDKWDFAMDKLLPTKKSVYIGDTIYANPKISGKPSIIVKN